MDKAIAEAWILWGREQKYSHWSVMAEGPHTDETGVCCMEEFQPWLELQSNTVFNCMWTPDTVLDRYLRGKKGDRWGMLDGYAWDGSTKRGIPTWTRVLERYLHAAHYKSFTGAQALDDLLHLSAFERELFPDADSYILPAMFRAFEAVEAPPPRLTIELDPYDVDREKRHDC